MRDGLRASANRDGNQSATMSRSPGQLVELPVHGHMGVQPPAVFPGTTAERDALLAAVHAACGCRRNQAGRTTVCGAHRMLLDERVLKYLIFYRRWREALWPGEGAGSWRR